MKSTPIGFLRALNIRFGRWAASIGQEQPKTSLKSSENVIANSQPVSALPQTADILPGRLKVKIHLHQMQFGDQKIPCWTFVTDGLISQKQKEIRFTLLRSPRQKPEDCALGLRHLFSTIYNHAESGDLLDVGDITLFGQSQFLGREDFGGMGYIAPELIPGVDTGNTPLLAAIMLKGDEAQVACDFGLTRVSLLIGRSYGYYPVPPWSDLEREPVTSLAAMQSSLLAEIKVPTFSLQARYYEESNNVHLQISRGSRERLQNALGQLDLTQSVMIRTNVDPRANACLFWSPVPKVAQAIMPLNSDASRKSGSFLLFVPCQKENTRKLVEDGIFLLLTDNDWKEVREALMSGNDFVLPSARKECAGLYIEWLQTTYTSAITGENWVCPEGWVKYGPGAVSPSLKGAAVRGREIVFLTGDADLKRSTSAEDITAYLRDIEEAADEFFATQKQRISRQIGVHFALTETGHDIALTSNPDLTPDDADALRRRLDRVHVPRVKGPVEFEFFLKVSAVAIN